jgi:hyperosmotically inducible protein
MKNVLPILIVSAVLVAGSAQAATAQVNDGWITMKTKIALLTADNVRSVGLNVDTANGVVTLHGKVSTEAEKTKAGTVAKGIEGVKEVKNLLQVVPESAEDAVEATDDAIKDRIDQAFKANVAVKDSGITIASVNKGVVLLQGETTSMATQLKAIELAHGAAGVKKVVSEIKLNEKTR